MDFSVQGIVNDYLRQKFEENIKNAKDVFRVSDMGRCYRMRIWKRQKKEAEPFDDRTLRILEAGNIFHWWLQKRLEDSGTLLEKEGEVKTKDGELVGHFDALVEKDGKKLLYDFKTQHSNSFHHIRKRGDKAKHHHMMQLMTYVYLLNEKYPDLTEGRLLLVSKDDLTLLEYGGKLEEWKNRVEKDIKTLFDYWNKKITPPPIPQDPSWECQYCIFKNQCDSKFKGGKNEG